MVRIAGALAPAVWTVPPAPMVTLTALPTPMPPVTAAATHALRQDAGGAIARRCDRALDAQVDGGAVAIFGGRRHRR
ncbi:hypothetical protein G6F23_015659 [Rhizopus arrhizus]|nr:hypothetical protein G6F23_015659 [Rhizopus arrhizus]